MRRQLVAALRMVAVFTVLTGVVYPFVVTGIAQALFSHKANGSLIVVHGKAVGSALIGQEFAKPQYFHPRPSAAGNGYDASSSSGSNQGPTNGAFLDEVKQRIVAYRAENGLSAGARVPVDAVTASASGLDPDISVANAVIQAKRVAHARGIPLSRVTALIAKHAENRSLGFLGEPDVNVLELNLALDRLA